MTGTGVRTAEVSDDSEAEGSDGEETAPREHTGDQRPNPGDAPANVHRPSRPARGVSALEHQQGAFWSCMRPMTSMRYHRHLQLVGWLLSAIICSCCATPILYVRKAYHVQESHASRRESLRDMQLQHGRLKPLLRL